MRLTTQNLPIGQQSIVVDIELGLEELARPIVGYFETQAQAGTRFQDGQTVELGWSLLLLRQIEGHLEVFEPDFDSMPIRWCKGVNNTVRHLHLQRAVCDLFDCEPLFPTIRHAGIISPNFLSCRDYTMSRDVPSGSDTGWVFAEWGYAESEGQFCSLYQLALQKVEIVPFLALPELSRITIKPGYREVTVNSISKSSVDNDFLRNLATSTILV